MNEVVFLTKPGGAEKGRIKLSSSARAYAVDFDDARPYSVQVHVPPSRTVPGHDFVCAFDSDATRESLVNAVASISAAATANTTTLGGGPVNPTAAAGVLSDPSTVETPAVSSVTERFDAVVDTLAEKSGMVASAAHGVAAAVSTVAPLVHSLFANADAIDKAVAATSFASDVAGDVVVALGEITKHLPFVGAVGVVLKGAFDLYQVCARVCVCDTMWC